jgi:hypothetical protein
MRRVRFGIVALVIAAAFLAADVALVVWRYHASLPPAISRPLSAAEDQATVRVDLCRIARAQNAFFRAVGRYATGPELRSDADLNLPGNDRRPYSYTVHTPVPDRFVVVASTVDTKLNAHAAAMTVDDTMQICILNTAPPDVGWRLDHPPETWGQGPTYDCEKCD